ncbi:MAG: O-antigen ligase family protein, partial [Blastocatellia bacterium]
YGLAMAVFALAQHFTWNGLFYWVRPMGELTSPFGPFINHNLFAGHMELLAFIPAGMALAGGVRGPARLFFVFASVMMSLSIVLSLSRGGTISLGAGMIFLAMMSGVVRKREESFMSLQRCPERMKTPLGTHRFQRAPAERTHFDEGSSSVSQHAGSDAYPGVSEENYQPPEPRRFDALRFTLRSVAVIAAMVGVIALGLLWLGPEPVINRVTQGQLTSADPRAQTFFTSRGWIWHDTRTMIRANPVLGVGLGAYETAYPIYTATDGSQKVSEAHNDYLQILADGGIIGALLALWFLWLIFRAIFNGAQARDHLLGSVALGGGAAIVAMLVHSFFDFNLQIPSNALMFLLHSAVASNIGAVSQVSMEPAVTGVELDEPMMKANAASLT